MESLLEALPWVLQYKISFSEETHLQTSYLIVLLKWHKWICYICMWKKAGFRPRVCLGSGKQNYTFTILPCHQLGLYTKCDQPWVGGKMLFAPLIQIAWFWPRDITVSSHGGSVNKVSMPNCTVRVGHCFLIDVNPKGGSVCHLQWELRHTGFFNVYPSKHS